MLVIKPYNVVIFLTIFIPLQETILKWLPVPDSVYIWLRLMTEIILYLILALVIIDKVFHNRPLKKTPIDILVIAFVGLSVLTMVWQNNLNINSLNNLRSLVRYLAIYYLVVNLPISRKQISTLLIIILSIGVFEGILAVGQYISDDFNSLFVLKDIEAGFAGVTKYFPVAKVGSVNGTFGSQAEMALFLLIAFVIALTYGYSKTRKNIPEPKYLIVIMVIIWGIFASFKRAALLSIPVLYAAVLYFGEKKRQLSYTIFLSIILLVIIAFSINWGIWNFEYDREYQTVRYRRVESFSLTDYFSKPFTTSYWEHVGKHSRGWFAVEVSRTMLREFNLLGYGPNQQNARRILAALDSSKFNIFIDRYAGFEDVYWVAMFVYYGAIGLTIFLVVLLLLFRTSIWITKYADQEEIRLLGIVFSSVMVLILIYTFIERTFEFRAFGFNFWLIAGLVVNAYNELRSQNKTQLEPEGSLT